MSSTLSELTIEVTQRCLNRCLFCSSMATPDARFELSPRHVLAVARQAERCGLRNISLSGGEPLLLPHLPTMVMALASIPLRVSLYTSGIVGRDDAAAAFEAWAKLRAADPTVIFNIQSTNAEIHDRLVGRVGALQLSMRSLQASVRSGLRNEVHIVPNRLNLASLETTVSDLRSIGAERVSFLRLVVQGNACDNADNLVLPPDQLTDFAHICRRIAEKDSGIRLGIPFSSLLANKLHCTAGKHKLIVRYDGKVLPCEAFKGRGDAFVLGDCRSDSIGQLLRRAGSHPRLASLKRFTSANETCPAQVHCSDIISPADPHALFAGDQYRRATGEC